MKLTSLPSRRRSKNPGGSITQINLEAAAGYGQFLVVHLDEGQLQFKWTLLNIIKRELASIICGSDTGPTINTAGRCRIESQVVKTMLSPVFAERNMVIFATPTAYRHRHSISLPTITTCNYAATSSLFSTPYIYEYASGIGFCLSLFKTIMLRILSWALCMSPVMTGYM